MTCDYEAKDNICSQTKSHKSYSASSTNNNEHSTTPSKSTHVTSSPSALSYGREEQKSSESVHSPIRTGVSDSDRKDQHWSYAMGGGEKSRTRIEEIKDDLTGMSALKSSASDESSHSPHQSNKGHSENGAHHQQHTYVRNISHPLISIQSDEERRKKQESDPSSSSRLYPSKSSSPAMSHYYQFTGTISDKYVSPQNSITKMTTPFTPLSEQKDNSMSEHVTTESTLTSPQQAYAAQESDVREHHNNPYTHQTDDGLGFRPIYRKNTPSDQNKDSSSYVPTSSPAPFYVKESPSSSDTFANILNHHPQYKYEPITPSTQSSTPTSTPSSSYNRPSPQVPQPPSGFSVVWNQELSSLTSFKPIISLPFNSSTSNQMQKQIVTTSPPHHHESPASSSVSPHQTMHRLTPTDPFLDASLYSPSQLQDLLSGAEMSTLDHVNVKQNKLQPSLQNLLASSHFNPSQPFFFESSPPTDPQQTSFSNHNAFQPSFSSISISPTDKSPVFASPATVSSADASRLKNKQQTAIPFLQYHPLPTSTSSYPTESKKVQQTNLSQKQKGNQMRGAAGASSSSSSSSSAPHSQNQPPTHNSVMAQFSSLPAAVQQQIAQQLGLQIPQAASAQLFQGSSSLPYGYEEIEESPLKFSQTEQQMFGLPKLSSKPVGHFETDQLPHNFHTQLPQMMPTDNVHGPNSFMGDLNHLLNKHFSRGRSPAIRLPIGNRPQQPSAASSSSTFPKLPHNPFASWFNKPKDLNNFGLIASSSQASYPSFAEPPLSSSFVRIPSPPKKKTFFTSLTRFFSPGQSEATLSTLNVYQAPIAEPQYLEVQNVHGPHPGGNSVPQAADTSFQRIRNPVVTYGETETFHYATPTSATSQSLMAPTFEPPPPTHPTNFSVQESHIRPFWISSPMKSRHTPRSIQFLSSDSMNQTRGAKRRRKRQAIFGLKTSYSLTPAGAFSTVYPIFTSSGFSDNLLVGGAPSNLFDSLPYSLLASDNSYHGSSFSSSSPTFSSSTGSLASSLFPNPFPTVPLSSFSIETVKSSPNVLQTQSGRKPTMVGRQRYQTPLTYSASTPLKYNPESGTFYEPAFGSHIPLQLTYGDFQNMPENLLVGRKIIQKNRHVPSLKQQSLFQATKGSQKAKVLSYEYMYRPVSLFKPSQHKRPPIRERLPVPLTEVSYEKVNMPPVSSDDSLKKGKKHKDMMSSSSPTPSSSSLNQQKQEESYPVLSEVQSSERHNQRKPSISFTRNTILHEKKPEFVSDLDEMIDGIVKNNDFRPPNTQGSPSFHTVYQLPTVSSHPSSQNFADSAEPSFSSLQEKSYQRKPHVTQEDPDFVRHEMVATRAPPIDTSNPIETYSPIDHNQIQYENHQGQSSFPETGPVYHNPLDVHNSMSSSDSPGDRNYEPKTVESNSHNYHPNGIRNPHVKYDLQQESYPHPNDHFNNPQPDIIELSTPAPVLTSTLPPYQIYATSRPRKYHNSYEYNPHSKEQKRIEFEPLEKEPSVKTSSPTPVYGQKINAHRENKIQLNTRQSVHQPQAPYTRTNQTPPPTSTLSPEISSSTTEWPVFQKHQNYLHHDTNPNVDDQNSKGSKSTDTYEYPYEESNDDNPSENLDSYNSRVTDQNYQEYPAHSAVPSIPTVKLPTSRSVGREDRHPLTSTSAPIDVPVLNAMDDSVEYSDISGGNGPVRPVFADETSGTKQLNEESNRDAGASEDAPYGDDRGSRKEPSDDQKPSPIPKLVQEGKKDFNLFKNKKVDYSKYLNRFKPQPTTLKPHSQEPKDPDVRVTPPPLRHWRASTTTTTTTPETPASDVKKSTNFGSRLSVSHQESTRPTRKPTVSVRASYSSTSSVSSREPPATHHSNGDLQRVSGSQDLFVKLSPDSKAVNPMLRTPVTGYAYKNSVFGSSARNNQRQPPSTTPKPTIRPTPLRPTLITSSSTSIRGSNDWSKFYSGVSRSTTTKPSTTSSSPTTSTTTTTSTTPAPDESTEDGERELISNDQQEFDSLQDLFDVLEKGEGDASDDGYQSQDSNRESMSSQSGGDTPSNVNISSTTQSPEQQTFKKVYSFNSAGALNARLSGQRLKNTLGSNKRSDHTPVSYLSSYHRTSSPAEKSSHSPLKITSSSSHDSSPPQQMKGSKDNRRKILLPSVF